MKKFSDFASDALPIDGSKMKIEEVLNREIAVIGFKINESKYNRSNSPKCLKLQFELDGERHVLFTGSTILCEQVQKYQEEIPFTATIKKIDKYYSFS